MSEKLKQAAEVELAKDVSRLLLVSKTFVESLVDLMLHHYGKVDTNAQAHIRQIEAFRQSQGWSPTGFGWETQPLHVHHWVVSNNDARFTVCECGEAKWTDPEQFPGLPTQPEGKE